MVDRRILPDLLWIAEHFPIYVTDGYSGPLPGGGHSGCDRCHTRHSDHYNGLAVDLVPGRRQQQMRQQLGADHAARALGRAGPEPPRAAVPLGRVRRRRRPRLRQPPAPLLEPLDRRPNTSSPNGSKSSRPRTWNSRLPCRRRSRLLRRRPPRRRARARPGASPRSRPAASPRARTSALRLLGCPAVRRCLSIAVVLALLAAAGCGGTGDSTPVACLERAGRLHAGAGGGAGEGDSGRRGADLRLPRREPAGRRPGHGRRRDAPRGDRPQRAGACRSGRHGEPAARLPDRRRSAGGRTDERHPRRVDPAIDHRRHATARAGRSSAQTSSAPTAGDSTQGSRAAERATRRENRAGRGCRARNCRRRTSLPIRRRRCCRCTSPSGSRASSPRPSRCAWRR